MVSERENFVPLNLALPLKDSERGNFRVEGLNPCTLKAIPRSCEESIWKNEVSIWERLEFIQVNQSILQILVNKGTFKT